MTIVIVDTDCGIFGDDGAALVMLVRTAEQIAIPGVTTVPGNVWGDQAAEYVMHILDLLKRPQIPVYTGAATPLVHTAAMAREAMRRWGSLEFMGAFADNEPLAVIPAPGRAAHGTPSAAPGRGAIFHLGNRAPAGRSDHPRARVR